MKTGLPSLLAMAFLTGCAFPFSGDRAEPGDILPPEARLHYVTDRAPETGPPRADSGPAYGAGRSAAMAYGTLSGGDGTADGTADGTGGQARVTEVLRFPQTPLPFSIRRGRPVTDPDSARAYADAAQRFRERIAAALREADRREVILFVHGINTSFRESAASTATIWQATGGFGVPVTFGWPARDTGILGYFQDRESGEFAIFHLKETLRLLAGIPELRRLHVVAHSRGTGVATTALREMVIAARASGRDPRRVLKIENLVLAAPDLDFGVVRQRLIAERFGPAFGRITVYMNPGDDVLALAQMVMAGQRFGRLSFEDLGPTEKEIFRRIANVDFISVANVVERDGHSYFTGNPAVLSDIATVLRSSVPPDDPSRYLSPDSGNFWRVENPPPATVIAAPQTASR